MVRDKERPGYVLLVATLVCVVCALLVSASVVVLRPVQDRNALLQRQRNILEVAGLYQAGQPVDGQFARIEPHLVDLESGDYVEGADAVRFDIAKAARDPRQSDPVPAEADVARIHRRPRAMPVFLVRGEAGIDTVILPVHGYGLWSTMYGFLALEGDGRTVKGITFYQHGETPGLGSEIDNPAWQARWVGKQALAADGSVLLRVVKGEPRGEGIEHQVDGLAGATLTARGVENLVHYWLGEQGFGPYLARLRAASGGAADET